MTTPDPCPWTTPMSATANPEGVWELLEAMNECWQRDWTMHAPGLLFAKTTCPCSEALKGMRGND